MKRTKSGRCKLLIAMLSFTYDLSLTLNRAYIAASRRSDRSLEARVESARRASEIHKRRTGRSLRVREEDVMNEEMYEEEDDDMSSHARRTFALAGLTGPLSGQLSDRLQSSIAMQMGMRDALSKALQRNELMLSGAAGNNPMANMSANGAGANMFATPAMYANTMGAPMLSPQAMQAQFNSPQQQWQTAMNMQQQPIHMRSASVSTPQDAYQQFQQQQFRNAAMQNNSVFNLRLDARRTSMPAPQQSVQMRPSQSPAGSHPSTPHGGAPTTTSNVAVSSASQSPHQVPTPPHSASAYTPGHNSSAGSPPMAAVGTPMLAQRSNSSANQPSNPLTLQLPTETQQMLGFQSAPSFAVSSPSLKPNNYSYNPNGTRKDQPQSFGTLPSHAQYMTMHQLQQMQMQMANPGAPLTGLNQTISPSAIDNTFGDGGSNDLPSSAISAPADFGYSGFMDFSNEFSPAMMAGNTSVFGDDGDLHTPGESNWNPEEFVDFGAPT